MERNFWFWDGSCGLIQKGLIHSAQISPPIHPMGALWGHEHHHQQTDMVAPTDFIQISWVLLHSLCTCMCIWFYVILSRQVCVTTRVKHRKTTSVLGCPVTATPTHNMASLIPATTDMFSASLIFVFVRILYKWNQAVCHLLRPAFCYSMPFSWNPCLCLDI
jgi:hypothetical protein